MKSKRPVKYSLFFCAALLLFWFAGARRASDRRTPGTDSAVTATVSQSPDSTISIPQPEPASADETMQVVVDDETGEILGEMVNMVGDYYIINPGDEDFIPKAGHSIKEVPIE